MAGQEKSDIISAVILRVLMVFHQHVRTMPMVFGPGLKEEMGAATQSFQLYNCEHSSPWKSIRWSK